MVFSGPCAAFGPMSARRPNPSLHAVAKMMIEAPYFIVWVRSDYYRSPQSAKILAQRKGPYRSIKALSDYCGKTA